MLDGTRGIDVVGTKDARRNAIGCVGRATQKRGARADKKVGGGGWVDMDRRRTRVSVSAVPRRPCQDGKRCSVNKENRIGVWW